jgi:ferredoxin
MKITLDADACVGHGRCYALAPEVFDADDQGHCVLRYDGERGEEVPVALADLARQGAVNCPEDALHIDGQSTG